MQRDTKDINFWCLIVSGISACVTDLLFHTRSNSSLHVFDKLIKFLKLIEILMSFDLLLTLHGHVFLVALKLKFERLKVFGRADTANLSRSSVFLCLSMTLQALPRLLSVLTFVKQL